MDIMELMRSRHSVRQYLDKPIPQDVRVQLNAYTEQLNQESGLHIQINNYIFLFVKIKTLKSFHR